MISCGSTGNPNFTSFVIRSKSIKQQIIAMMDGSTGSNTEKDIITMVVDASEAIEVKMTEINDEKREKRGRVI